MANAIEIGKVNEVATLSDSEENDKKTGQNGTTLPSKKAESQGSCAKQNTNIYCQFIASHTKLAFGRF